VADQSAGMTVPGRNNENFMAVTVIQKQETGNMMRERRSQSPAPSPLKGVDSRPAVLNGPAHVGGTSRSRWATSLKNILACASGCRRTNSLFM